MKKLKVIICLIFILILCSCAHHETKETVFSTNLSYDFVAHFLNLENGTCFVFELPNGKCMLVDCGSSDDFPNVYSFLNEHKIHCIDYIVITKCDYLHCGGINKILENFEVKNCFVPKSSNSKSLKNIISINQRYDVSTYYAFSGVEIMKAEDLCIDVVSPDETSPFGAIALVIQYGETSFLIDGEVDEQLQNEIYTCINDGIKIDVVVLCANTDQMISVPLFQKIKANYAVINFINGTDVPMNFKIIKTIESLGLYPLRTDTLGCITIKSNSCEIKINTQY